ncbi:MAG: ATP-grasp domain-containing protein [Proteobacteria bacterium]|nr:ATP-grasp domain-containing protein [Pseudomonadota bacterium]
MNFGILFGGTSSERFVSCASAQFVAEQLADCALYFWSDKGEFFEIHRQALFNHKDPFKSPFIVDQNSAIKNWPNVDAFLSEQKSLKNTLYLSLHGGDGENGYFQKRCETMGVGYTGSISSACALAMDKVASKDVVKKIGVKVAEGVSFSVGDNQYRKNLESLLKSSGSIIVKPRSDGSSVGLSFIHSLDDLNSWCHTQEKASLNQGWLAEEMIKGRELTVGVVMHHKCLTVLPPSEVVLEANANFDYEGKYLGKGNKEVTPADLTIAQRVKAQEVSLLAHTALGCFGYTRTDMIMSSRGLLYLETNTLPGLTRMSFIPQQLAAAGISAKEFFLGQLELAYSRNH